MRVRSCGPHTRQVSTHHEDVFFVTFVTDFTFPSLFCQFPVEPEVARHASLYHQVALVLLPWLLPGSEYLAHELLSTILFNKDFIS